MKFLHTSDLQLDAPFLFLGERGQQHREQLLKTFASIVKMAEESDYQLLLIAGDLFNSNHPQQLTVDFVISLLRKLSIPVCLLPGNHDPYDSTSIYRRVDFPPNVFLFTDRTREKVFPGLDCVVYGNAVLNKDPMQKPLGGIVRREGFRWQIAMAHGSVVAGKVERPERPIQLEEIRDCDMDYVALGDWHSFADYSQGNIRAIYSGAPEPTAYDQLEAGYIASVSLEEEGCHVEKIRVGKVQAKQLNLDLSGRSESVILDLILDHAGEHKMLEVSLTGMVEFGTVVNTDQLQALLSAHFYALRLRDLTYPEFKGSSQASHGSNDVINKYIEFMQGRIARAADDEVAARTAQALQVGVALLQGKEVL